MDKYDEVALQIVDAIKENFSENSDSNHKLDDNIHSFYTDLFS